MSRNQLIFIPVALLALIGLGSLLQTQDPIPSVETSDAPHTPPSQIVTDTPVHRVSPPRVSPPRVSPPRSSPEFADDTDAPNLPPRERPEPINAEEEAIFALADAAGLTVARCSAADYPEGTSFGPDSVITEGFITFLVKPSDESPNITVGIDPPFIQAISDAEVGGMGNCTVSKVDFSDTDNPLSSITLVEGDFEAEAAELNNKSEQVAFDAEDEMLPEQVALDSSELSPEARQWLLDRIAAKEDDALEKIEQPVTPEERASVHALLNEKLAEIRED